MNSKTSERDCWEFYTVTAYPHVQPLFDDRPTSKFHSKNSRLTQAYWSPVCPQLVNVSIYRFNLYDITIFHIIVFAYSVSSFYIATYPHRFLLSNSVRPGWDYTWRMAAMSCAAWPTSDLGIAGNRLKRGQPFRLCMIWYVIIYT